MKRETIRLADGDVSMLRWNEAGPGAPLLHLAHATGMNAQNYRQLAERLKAHFRIVMSDSRGHGFTTLPANPADLFNWSTFENDLARIMDHLAEPALLVGHSMGAAVTLTYAANNPQLARGLVLIDPAVVPLERAAAHAAARAAGERADGDMGRAARKRRRDWASRDEIRAKYDGRGMFAFWAPGILDDYLDGGLITHADGSVSLACDPQWEAEIFNAVDVRIWELAPCLHMPVAMMRADAQSTVSEVDAGHFQRLIPQLEMHYAKGRSHFVPMEDVELTAQFILGQADRMLVRNAA